MMKLFKAAPTFPVADVDSTIRWYETKFGFTSYPFPKNPPYVFASVCRDQVEIMFQRVDGYQKPDLYHRRSGGVWDAYIRMESVKDAIQNRPAVNRSPRTILGVYVCRAPLQ